MFILSNSFCYLIQTLVFPITIQLVKVDRLYLLIINPELLLRGSSPNPRVYLYMRFSNLLDA